MHRMLFIKPISPIMTFIAMLIICSSPVAVQANIYEGLLPLLTVDPDYPNDENAFMQFRASDVLVNFSDMSSVSIPVKVARPSGLKSKEDPGKFEMKTGEVISNPVIEVHWATVGSDWNVLDDHDVLSQVDLIKKNTFELKLPQIEAKEHIQFIVIRLRATIDGKIQRELKLLVGVVPQNHTLKSVVFDIDGTLAADNESLIQVMAMKLRNYVAQGYLINYVTTRGESWATKTRQWLIEHDLAPGILLTAPDKLNQTPESRKDFKKKRILEVSKIIPVEQSSGDSAIADALAAMEAGVPIVVLLEEAGNEDANPATIDSRLPPNYTRNRRTGRVIQTDTGKSDQFYATKHTYTQQQQPSVELTGPVESIAICAGLNPPNISHQPTVPLAHRYLAAQAMALQQSSIK